MIFRVTSLDWRRRRLLKRTPTGPLRQYLSAPFPDLNLSWDQVEFVALDLETTGFDPATDAIVSVGMVRLQGPRIDLGSAQHRVIQIQQQPLSERSIVVHGLTHDAVAAGEPLSDVIRDVLAQLAGKVLLAHYATMELGFLRAACEQLYGGGFLAPVVDTQRLALQWLERRAKHYTVKDLRLFNLRDRYNLPKYQAHNALNDALGTAELFTAQMAERSPGRPLKLKAILSKH